jgi:hypothetical protein
MIQVNIDGERAWYLTKKEYDQLPDGTVLCLGDYDWYGSLKCKDYISKGSLISKDDNMFWYRVTRNGTGHMPYYITETMIKSQGLSLNQFMIWSLQC